MLINTNKFVSLFCIYFLVLGFNQLSAKILYESNSTIVNSYLAGSAFLEENSFNDDIFNSIEASILAREEILNNFYAKFYASATYLSNRKNDDSYDILDELYLGFDSEYGNLYIGNTPTVYYNGFPAGWLDYKLINSQYDATDPNAYGSFFTTKSASNSIFYSYRFSKFKIALQSSIKDSKEVKLDNQQAINLDRKYSLGIGLGYAYGPIQFGGSYINSKFSDSGEFNDDYILSVASIGAKLDVFGLYSAIGIFYDNNRWHIGNESYSFQYLIKYDNYRIFNKRIVPQIAYSYKYYTRINDFDTSNVVTNNDLYVSLSYFLNSYLEVFVEGKLDMRNSFQVEKINNIIKQDKYLRYNRIGLGVKAIF